MQAKNNKENKLSEDSDNVIYELTTENETMQSCSAQFNVLCKMIVTECIVYMFRAMTL